MTREMISAQIDGELDPSDGALLDAHIETCASCAAYQDDAFALRRSLRMRAVAPEPEATEARAANVELAGSMKGISVLRWALFVIGGTLVALNMTALVTSEGGTAAHLSRHDAIFGTALGIGMLVVAAKPHRAIGMVPLTSTIAVLMAIAAGADLINGQANLLSEAVHVVEFAGLVCLWVISGGPSRLPQYIAVATARLPQVPLVSRPHVSELRTHPETV